jgi:hypothetical protein
MRDMERIKLVAFSRSGHGPGGKQSDSPVSVGLTTTLVKNDNNFWVPITLCFHDSNEKKNIWL